MPTTNYIWETINDCVMHETDGDDSTLVEYTHEPVQYGPLISENRDSTEYVHHYDALGSTTMLTDDTESVTDTFKYDAWGNEAAHAGTTETPYRWLGQWGGQYDSAIQNYYVRARVYQPSISRWCSADPFLFATDFGLYVYATNCPVLLIDASGLKEEPPFPAGDDQWWVNYTGGPKKLDDCKYGYEWNIVQHFKTKRPGLWQPTPRQTWQLNNVSVTDVLFASDGKCFSAKANDAVLVDVAPFPKDPSNTHLISNIPDTLALDMLKGLPKMAVVCRLTETVHKKLGFDDGQKRPLPRGTHKPTAEELKRIANMRGPFLIMDTTYTFKNPCGACKMCLEIDEGCGGGNPECKETYEATVARGSTEEDFKNKKNIGPWSGTKKCK